VTGRPARRVAFLGLGLVGGSIAQALATNPKTGRPAENRPRMAAWTPAGRGPAAAFAGGAIDHVASDPADALSGADLVIIAAPPLETVELIGRLGSDLRNALLRGALVTDVASTKGAIIAAALAVGVPFVGGHPMAGREAAGYGAARPDLFIDRAWLVVRPPDVPEAAAGPVRWLAEACGAIPMELTAEAHDAATAAISHLPLVASASLVEAVAGPGGDTWSIARRLAASGWDGMTRLARGDARMGAGIATTNAVELAAALRAYRSAIDAWIADLERAGGPDATRLQRRLEAARSYLDEPPTRRE